MTNIQDILNNIQKSDIAKLGRNGGLDNISKRKKVYVFYLGELIDVVDGRRQAELKYGLMRVHTSLRRKRPIKGYYFSFDNKYEPNERWVNSERHETTILYKDGTTKKFATQMECGKYLGMSRGVISAVKTGLKKLPKRYTDIEKIIFDN